MTSRRYSDDEVAAIFAKAIATESIDTIPAERPQGLSLAQVQEIGREVGLHPDALAKAAQMVESGGPARTRSRQMELIAEELVQG